MPTTKLYVGDKSLDLAIEITRKSLTMVAYLKQRSSFEIMEPKT